MDGARNTSEKAIYVIAIKSEIDAIAVFLRRGFLELEANELRQTYHLPLLLLSQGLERLLKFSIYLVEKEHDIPHKEWLSEGHNLNYLSSRLWDVLDQLGSSSAQAVMQELASLQNNGYFCILSVYGKPGRYANLDRLAKEGKNIDKNTFKEKSKPSTHVQFKLNTSTPDDSWRAQRIIDTVKLVNGGTKAKMSPMYPVFLSPVIRTLRAITLLLSSDELW